MRRAPYLANFKLTLGSMFPASYSGCTTTASRYDLSAEGLTYMLRVIQGSVDVKVLTATFTSESTATVVVHTGWKCGGVKIVPFVSASLCGEDCPYADIAVAWQKA